MAMRAPVVQVARDTGLIHSEELEGALHAVKGRALPHKLHREVHSGVGGRMGAPLQLQNHLRHCQKGR